MIADRIDLANGAAALIK